MSFITNRSVLLNNPNCVSNTDYNELIRLRSMKSRDGGVPTEVRSSGANVDIPDNATYEAYKMRRKVEILKHTNLVNPTNLHFSRLAKIKQSSENSQHAIENQLICDEVPPLLPPTYSGIRDPGYPGYQLNPLIRFRLYL
jgi:hypothetical protein